MIRDRSELEVHLQDAIERIKYKRKNVEEVNKSLLEFDVPPGFFNEVCKKYSILQEIDAALLCLISKAVFMIDGSDSIRVENYFTQGEIESASKYKLERDQDIKLPIILNDVIKIDNDRYFTKIKMTDLVQWYHSKLIVYDAETQRGLRFIRSRDGVVPVPIVNKDSVDNIANHMEEETFFTDTIRLNVYSEEFEPVIYNPKTRMLTIKEGVTISILDGFHRLQGGVRAVMKNPELPLVEELSICIYDTETAKKFFGQINKYNPIDPQRLEELDEEKVSFAAVKQLKIHSVLKGRIASGSKISGLVGHLTTESILANAIEEVFEPRNTPQANSVGVYLVEFFNYLFETFKDQINNKESLLGHQRMFIGYIVIAKQFKDSDIPFEEIKVVVNYFNPDYNEELRQLLTNNRGTQARLQKLVKEYFEKTDVKSILKSGE